MRVPRSNAQFIFLMRAPVSISLRNMCKKYILQNDMLSIRNLAHQLFPKESTFFLDAYKQACSDPFGYLLGLF